MKNTNIQPRTMKQLYALTQKRPIDLSLSENPLGCSPIVSNALKNIKLALNDYPSPNGQMLKKSLSKIFTLSEDNFFIANGSESIINDLPKVLGNAQMQALVPALSFPMFSICSQLAGLEVITAKMQPDLSIDLDQMAKLISPKTKLIFICNPNNPTGSVLAKSEIIEFLNRVSRDILVVIDEANIEFGGDSVINQVKNRENVIVLRTFSKGFGLASLRIGFATANKKIIQKLEEQTPIFQISGLSEKLACLALEDKAFIASTKAFVTKQRQLLKTQLQKFGFNVFPSQANNLFIRLPSFLNPRQFTKNLQEQGISLVSGDNFEGFDNRFFRVSIRDQKTNLIFLKKINQIIRSS